LIPSVAVLVLLTSPAPAAVTRDKPQATQATKPAEDQQPAEPPKGKKPKPKEAQPKEDYPVFRLADHPRLVFGKGTHLDFRARFSADKTDFEPATGASSETSTTDLGKRRIGVSGEIADIIEFQVERELTDNDPWRDVYAEYKAVAVARVRGGKFKLPFSLDENTGASRLDFMFRSLAATHLAPGRDTGVMAQGRVWRKLIGYEAGVFSHDGRNARTNNPAKVSGGRTTAGRVTIEPLRDVKNPAGDLSIGVAFTHSDVPEGIAGLRGQTVLEQNFFSAADYFVNGPRRRTGLEMQFLPGPASIKAEWIRVSTERRGQSVEDTDLSPLIGEGWYVSGTYAITGEKKSNVGNPKKPFMQGGFGAVEVGARVESLTFRSGATGDLSSSSPRADVILGNRNQVTTVGVNWYINRFFKIQANIIREKLDDPSQGPLPARPSFTTRAIRVQFSL
jgi:phosphate-selective porin